MAATVVELDRFDRAELRAGQFGDEDVVVAVERFGAAARPVDPQGAADAIDDRGLVDDLRTGDRRQGDAVARPAGGAALEHPGELFLAGRPVLGAGGGRGREARGGTDGGNHCAQGSPAAFKGRTLNAILDGTARTVA